MATYLVTGACGFIGANFVHFLIEQEPSAHVVAVDDLGFAANEPNLDAVRDRVVPPDHLELVRRPATRASATDPPPPRPDLHAQTDLLSALRPASVSPGHLRDRPGPCQPQEQQGLSGDPS